MTKGQAGRKPARGAKTPGGNRTYVAKPKVESLKQTKNVDGRKAIERMEEKDDFVLETKEERKLVGERGVVPIATVATQIRNLWDTPYKTRRKLNGLWYELINGIWECSASTNLGPPLVKAKMDDDPFKALEQQMLWYWKGKPRNQKEVLSFLNRLPNIIKRSNADGLSEDVVNDLFATVYISQPVFCHNTGKWIKPVDASGMSYYKRWRNMGESPFALMSESLFGIDANAIDMTNRLLSTGEFRQTNTARTIMIGAATVAATSMGLAFGPQVAALFGAYSLGVYAYNRLTIATPIVSYFGEYKTHTTYCDPDIEFIDVKDGKFVSPSSLQLKYPMHPSAALKCPSVHTCTGSRKLPVIFSVSVKPTIPTNCSHNIYKALVSRQLIDGVAYNKLTGVDYNPNSWKEGRIKFMQRLFDPTARKRNYNLLEGLDELKQKYPHVLGQFEITLQEFLRRYPETTRNQMLKEYENFCEGRAVKPDGLTKMFVKIEALLKDVVLDGFDPRAISGKKAEYLLFTCLVYYAFQKMMNIELFNADSPWCCSSGMTGEQVGRWFEYWHGQGYTNIICVDYSRFDGSRTVESIQAVNDFTHAILHDYDCEISLFDNLKDRGVANDGTRYERDGGFCSGRIDTTEGNTIANFISIDYGIEGIDYVCIVIGDDSIILTRTPIDLVKYTWRLRTMGLVPKINQTDDIYAVEYCSKWFWPTNTGLVLDMKVGRYLAKTFFMKSQKTDDELAMIARGIVLSTANSNYIPFIQLFHNWMMDGLGKGKAKFDKNLEWKMNLSEEHLATHDTEFIFERRYGYSTDSLKDIFTQPFHIGINCTHPILDEIVRRDIDSDDIAKRYC